MGTPDQNLSIGAAAQVEPEPAFVPEATEPMVEAPKPSILDRIFTAETGPGRLSDYKEHTLNFTGDEPGSRIARGLTGIFENALNLAIIDLLVGGGQLALRAWGARRQPNATT